MRRRGALALLLCLSLAACTSADGIKANGHQAPPSGGVTPSEPPSEPPTASPSGPAQPTPGEEPQRTVARVGLKQSDLGGTGTVELIPHGDEVDGQVTLDDCGFVFTTEADRTARRQVAVTLDAAKEGASYGNEVVTYADEATAAHALDEERESMRSCDQSAFQASAAGGSFRYETLQFTEHLGGFLVPDGVSLTQRITGQDGTVFYVMALYFQAGTVLDAHYWGSPHAPSRKEISTLAAQARITTARLTDHAV